MISGNCPLSRQKNSANVISALNGEYDGVESRILESTTHGIPVRLIVSQAVPKPLIYALGKTDRSILQFEVDLLLKNPKGLWSAMQTTNYCGVAFLFRAFNIAPGLGHQERIFDSVSRFERFGGVGWFFFRFYDGKKFPVGADASRMERNKRDFIWQPTPRYATEFIRRLEAYRQHKKGFRYGICGITLCDSLF